MIETIVKKSSFRKSMIFVILLFSFNMFSQTTDYDATGVLNGQANFNESIKMSKFLEITWKNVKEINGLFNLDVFEYYDLSEKYPTDLQKKVFKKSDEYKALLNELTAKEGDFQKKTFFLNLSPVFKHHSYWKNSYDISKGGFLIKMCRHTEFEFQNQIGENRIFFKALPMKTFYEKFGKTNYWSVLFVDMNEEKGIEIETNPRNYEMYVFYKISHLEKITFRGEYSNMQDKLTPISDKARIIIINKTTQSVMFDKSY